MKRLTAPKSWMLDKTGGAFVSFTHVGSFVIVTWPHNVYNCKYVSSVWGVPCTWVSTVTFDIKFLKNILFILHCFPIKHVGFVSLKIAIKPV